MEFNNAKLSTSPGLIKRKETLLLDYHTKAAFEMSVFSVDLVLHPIEFLAMSELFGKGCIGVSSVIFTQSKDVIDATMADLITRYADGKTVIGNWSISGTVYLSGNNLARLCSNNTASLFDENSVLLTPDSIVTKLLLPIIYYRVHEMLNASNMPFTNVKLKSHRVTDTPMYQVALQKDGAVVLCCTNKDQELSFLKTVTPDQVKRFRECSAEKKYYSERTPIDDGSAIILLARLPLISYLTMRITAPAIFRVIDADDFWSTDAWNRKELANEDSLNKMYMMPDQTPITCVVRFPISQHSLDILNDSIVYTKWYQKYFMDSFDMALKKLQLF